MIPGTIYDKDGRYLETDEFNAFFVVRYWVLYPKPSIKKWHLSRIQKHKYKNFFRSLFGQPLLKPKRPWRDWTKPYVVVEFVAGRQKTFRYKSNKRAYAAYEALDNFMKSPY